MIIPFGAATGAPPRHVLTLEDLGPHGLQAMVDLTARIKRDPASVRGALDGGRVGMIFDTPSTRTRVSFESAAWLLGILPMVLRPDELRLGRGETIGDTARALSLYLDAITVRTRDQATVEDLAAASRVPVINALTDQHHPCQALADVMTIEEEFGTLAGIQVGFIGGGDSVCHALVQAAAMGGFEIRIASPPGYEPDPAIVEAARTQAAMTGGGITLVTDPAEAVLGTEVVYVSSWAAADGDAESEARRDAFHGFTVDADVMALASRAAILLHPLPARRGEEVTDEVIDGSASRVWSQAANRLHTETALLYTVLTGDPTGARLG